MNRRPFTLAAVVTGTALVFSACQDDPIQPASPDGGPEVAAQQVPLVGARGQEELVDAIPGFGGLYIDEDGVANIHVTNVDDVGPADLAVMGYLARLGTEAPRGIRLRQADFTIPQLDQWFQETSPAVLGQPGAVFVDLDDRENRITIGVEDPGAAENARTIATQLGMPAEAIRVVLTEPILPMNSLQDRHRPVVGGLQINFPGFLCTLGFNAIAQVTTGKGKRRTTVEENSFITNSHCTNVQGGTEGTPYWQPLESVDPVQIGTEVDDPRYSGGKGRNNPCPRGFVCRQSDASRAAYADGITFELGKIAMPDVGPNASSVAWTTGNFFNIVAEGTAVVGNTANKVGRTTGWTQGTVTATNVDTGVSGTNIVQLGQTFVENSVRVVQGGDSGSGVFLGTGNVTLVGILWGGNGAGTLFVFSPLSNVESELGELTTF